MLADNGNPSTVYDITSMMARMIHDNRKYGISFPSIIVAGLTGDTSSRSIVPFSFSRTIDTEVMMAHISMKIIPMIPGTKLYALFILGLYSVRVIIVSPPDAPPVTPVM